VTVDTTGPTVTDIAPADGATDVAVDAAISATFSEALDPATVTVSTVTLTTGGDSDPIAVPVSLDYTAATHSLSLAPTSPLQAGVEYRARVKGGSGGGRAPSRGRTVRAPAGASSATRAAWRPIRGWNTTSPAW
jgi:hypothetical protein